MKAKILAPLLALLLFASSQAHALTYFLNQNNSGLEGGPWASVTLTDTTYVMDNKSYDAVKISVAPMAGAFSGGVTDKFGLKEFRFNEATNLSDFAASVSVSSLADWSFKYYPSSSAGPYGRFEFSLFSATERANPLEFYLYSTEALNAEDFAVTGGKDYLFATHITGFHAYDSDQKPVESAWFATDDDAAPVPEPGTLALLGAGFLGLVFYRRRTGN